MAEPNHARRIAAVWLIVTLIAMPLVIFVLGPALPPGNGSEQATGHVTDNTVLMAVMTPVLLLLIVYFIYALIFFRQKPGETLEGPAIRGNARVQTAWIVVTSAIVLSLAAYGTARLLDDGAGSGGGSAPVVVPAGPKLQVQVIGQQWAFTYRYPSYGGVETPHLVLPAGQTVELHVTSLDVVHSFWAYQLGVKADANPGQDNVVFVEPTEQKSFSIRCSELCGLWHGYMFDHGDVVSGPKFKSWIAGQRVKFAPSQKLLPPYSTTYIPEPARRAG